VHELYEENDVVEAVARRFGAEVVPDGAVDRSLLAQRAFADPTERAWLEELLWPRVGRRMVAWRAELERSAQPPRAAAVEVPLLFESGLDHVFDATIAVVAEEGLRAKRAGTRGHQALEERSARQLSQQEKAHRATYVVENDGTIEQLEEELSAILTELNQ
jgi:dephospho-CoA kinase